MVARKCLLFIAIFALLICTGEAAAGPNANAVLSLDLIADGGAGNQRDDGVISGTVSGQGTKIAVEVFAKGVTTPLLGILVEFDFDASVLTYDQAQNSAFIGIFPAPDGTAFGAGANTVVTLPPSGFLARAEFTTAVDVTDREFSIGIKRVGLAESPTSRDSITTTNVVTFNAVPSPDVAPSPDFDGDGVVGIPDFLQFVDRFGAMRGDGKYEAKYDLDGNGAIGIPDFLIFVDNFGKEVPPSGDAEMVTIPDMNLRAVIEDSLGKASGAPITRDEMATLTRFAAVNANISDLTGLEFATGLTVLGIGNTSISDLAPLSGLTNLQGLLLVNNNISDISSLSGLTGLTTLILSNNSISDLSPLSGLTGLQGLLLDNNSISDLSPLVENTGLGSGDEVNVRSNPLSNTSIDTHIPALQGRGVTVLFHVIDPTPVNIPDENLRAAIEDALDKSSGATITRGDMSTLTSLNASNANISDLTGLEFAIFLTSLVLHNNSITDLSPLSGMTSLTRLRLENNSISDVSALSGLTNLTTLWLHANTITDISVLSNLTSLRTLNLSNNTITDISALSGLTSLTWLNLSSNSISEVSAAALSNLTSLTWLSLYDNSITNISALSNLTSLTWLSLYDNTITDISALSNLISLTTLRLYYNSISDLSPLSDLTSLTSLLLYNNSITDLSPLVTNTGLGNGDEVNVSNNPLSDASINTHIPALQGRGVEVQF